MSRTLETLEQAVESGAYVHCGPGDYRPLLIAWRKHYPAATISREQTDEPGAMMVLGRVLVLIGTAEGAQRPGFLMPDRACAFAHRALLTCSRVTWSGPGLKECWPHEVPLRWDSPVDPGPGPIVVHADVWQRVNLQDHAGVVVVWDGPDCPGWRSVHASVLDLSEVSNPTLAVALDLEPEAYALYQGLVDPPTIDELLEVEDPGAWVAHLAGEVLPRLRCGAYVQPPDRVSFIAHSQDVPLVTRLQLRVDPDVVSLETVRAVLDGPPGFRGRHWHALSEAGPLLTPDRVGLLESLRYRLRLTPASWDQMHAKPERTVEVLDLVFAAAHATLADSGRAHALRSGFLNTTSNRLYRAIGGEAVELDPLETFKLHRFVAAAGVLHPYALLEPFLAYHRGSSLWPEPGDAKTLEASCQDLGPRGALHAAHLAFRLGAPALGARLIRSVSDPGHDAVQAVEIALLLGLREDAERFRGAAESVAAVVCSLRLGESRTRESLDGALEELERADLDSAGLRMHRDVCRWIGHTGTVADLDRVVLRLGEVRDALSTNSHFCLSVVGFMDAVIASAVELCLRGEAPIR